MNMYDIPTLVTVLLYGDLNLEVKFTTVQSHVFAADIAILTYNYIMGQKYEGQRK